MHIKHNDVFVNYYPKKLIIGMKIFPDIKAYNLSFFKPILNCQRK